MSCNSRGVLILVKDQLDFKLLKLIHQFTIFFLRLWSRTSHFYFLTSVCQVNLPSRVIFPKQFLRSLKVCLLSLRFCCGCWWRFQCDLWPRLRREWWSQENKRLAQGFRRYLFGVGFDRYLACQASHRETFTQCQKTQIIQRQVDFWLISDG